MPQVLHEHMEQVGPSLGQLMPDSVSLFQVGCNMPPWFVTYCKDFGMFRFCLLGLTGNSGSSIFDSDPVHVGFVMSFGV